MPPRILIVDDEPDLLDILSIIFSAFGFETATACNGEEAVQAVHAAPPDVVLMDVMMPRMSGFDACRVLKSDPETRHIPVVMLSARAQQEDQEAGYQAGAEGYVLKPFDNMALVAEVKRVLEASDAS